ncbi:AraC family transcriptional regulator, partial [Pseudomonas frederiksbergensis]|nr:AraC family transcriptional regulator [Pseudomonas frederiksbergensis]
DTLKQAFPAIEVDADAIFIQQGTVWTSAGVSAGIDLALALVEADCGREVSMAVARELVVYLKRPGGQAQYSTLLQSQ